MFEEGQKLNLPFNEEGILLEIKDVLWGFRYIVEITKGGTINQVGDIVEYKRSQLIKKFKFPENKKNSNLVTRPKPTTKPPTSRIKINESVKTESNSNHLFKSEVKRYHTPSKYKHKDVEQLISNIIKNYCHYQNIKGFNEKAVCNYCGNMVDIQKGSNDIKIKHDKDCIYLLACKMNKEETIKE